MSTATQTINIVQTEVPYTDDTADLPILHPSVFSYNSDLIIKNFRLVNSEKIATCLIPVPEIFLV